MIRKFNLKESNYSVTNLDNRLDELVDILRELCKYTKLLEVEYSKESDLCEKAEQLSYKDISKAVNRQAKLNGFPTIEDNEISASMCVKLADDLLDRVAFLIGDLKKQNHTMQDVIESEEY